MRPDDRAGEPSEELSVLAGGHLDEGDAHAFVDGALSDEAAARVIAHVAGCERCAGVLAEARGLAAAATRILGALDHVPGGVVPAAPAASAPPLSTPRAAAERAPAPVRPPRPAAGAGPRWTGWPVRIAATLLLVAGVGSAAWRARRGDPNAAASERVMAATASTSDSAQSASAAGAPVGLDSAVPAPANVERALDAPPRGTSAAKAAPRDRRDADQAGASPAADARLAARPNAVAEPARAPAPLPAAPAPAAPAPEPAPEPATESAPAPPPPPLPPPPPPPPPVIAEVPQASTTEERVADTAIARAPAAGAVAPRARVRRQLRQLRSEVGGGCYLLVGVEPAARAAGVEVPPRVTLAAEPAGQPGASRILPAPANAGASWMPLAGDSLRLVWTAAAGGIELRVGAPEADGVRRGVVRTLGAAGAARPASVAPVDCGTDP